MKAKLITIAAAVAATATSAVAQTEEMVAAWDFSQVGNLGGFITTNGSSLTSQLSANYTGTSADFAGGALVGTLDLSSLANAGGVNGDVFVATSGNTSVADRGFIGVPGSLNQLTFDGQQFANNWGLGLQNNANNGSLDFGIDLTSGFGEDWNVSFAALTVNSNGSSIDWAYSVDGGAFQSTGLSTAISGGALQYDVDFSGIAALDGASSIVLRANLNGIDAGEQTFIDNFAVDATIVPEPSTYAAIAGALALAFVAYRRRS